MNLGCVMTWISLLEDPQRELVPLKVFPLLCKANSLGWSKVYVAVIASRPTVRSIQPPSVASLVFDLGLPTGWKPGDVWPGVPLDVRFYWELAAGTCSDSIDRSATLLSFTRLYHTHSPPAVLRQEWRELAAPVSSPCTPCCRELLPMV